ncbi:hypothetical protein [Hoeflea prorocentri]|uniref:Curlin n=1 Tax=Hoeflea prorocentri TaxID=1922333 RepID=A0A9X3UJ86_9HYPH|nr:hypothetical protein [Hoeflea prorocentri]MCY6382367.1 hypothetical protein [Hoeflea prorocentri]MDA5400167.1 hypothetical protein [Hoeflea prorocentri]
MKNSIVLAAAAFLIAGEALADNIGFSAGNMWGTDGSGVAVGGAVDSAESHLANGIIAGQVNAAEMGLLIDNGTAGTLTIQAIGSQTVVTTSIVGNNNVSDIAADQTSTNSGDVTNDGEINSR